MTEISAEILADSVNPDGQRATTFVCVFPRFILAEVTRHRALSFNTASSRAIPVAKMVEQLRADPAVPIRWGKAGPGMQDHGILPARQAEQAEQCWRWAARKATYSVSRLVYNKVHKQVCNRILEPFAWTTAIVTGTDWTGFFRQRCHRDAQPEFQRLAHLMLRAYVQHRPTPLGWGGWHVPYGDRMPDGIGETARLKVAVARCARVSYMTHDGAIDVGKDLALFDRLAGSTPRHLSPLEHVAEAVPGRHANFAGFRQLRTHYEDVVAFDAAAHLAAYEATLSTEDQ